MTPVYGNGQGASDSPSQWREESAMLFDIYKSRMQGAEMSLQTGERLVKFPLAAFADDTNLLGNNDHRLVQFQVTKVILHEVYDCFCHSTIVYLMPSNLSLLLDEWM
jgi:hypothetical protein